MRIFARARRSERMVCLDIIIHHATASSACTTGLRAIYSSAKRGTQQPCKDRDRRGQANTQRHEKVEKYEEGTEMKRKKATVHIIRLS